MLLDEVYDRLYPTRALLSPRLLRRKMLARRAPVSGSGWICKACRSHARYQAASSLRSSSTAATRQRPIHLAVIGSGPAGYYTAYRLLKKLPDARIDMFESLPVPYGLVRYGVAPDHPEVKVCSPNDMSWRYTMYPHPGLRHG